MLAAKIDACGAWDVASWAARFSAVLFGQEKSFQPGRRKAQENYHLVISHSHGKSPFLIAKPSISMGHFLWLC
jgi:hypothetical protein